MNIEAILRPLREFFQKMTRQQRIRLIVLSVLLVVVIVVAFMVFGRTEYAVLYSGLSPADAGELLNVIRTEQQETAKLEDNGQTISVPADKRDEILVALASSGYYPQTGTSYDIYEKANSLTATESDKRTYLRFQMEETLQTTLQNMERVRSAKVMINLAETSAFAVSAEGKSTASVALTLNSQEELDSKAVTTIAELVAGAVKNLAPGDVSISDQYMRSYNSGDSMGVGAASEQLEYQMKMQEMIEKRITDQLTPVFGAGNVIPRVTVKLDFDEKVTQTTEFSPPIDGEEGGLVISDKLYEEFVRGQSTAEGEPGMDTNGGSIVSYEEQLANTDSDYYKRELQNNYELNELKEQITAAKGKLTDLDVAVLLNSSLEIDDYTEEIRGQVAAGLGIKPEDVDVKRLPFQEIEAAEDEKPGLLSSSFVQQLIRLIIIIGAALVIAIMLLRLIRDILQARREEREAERAAASAAAEAFTQEQRVAATAEEIDEGRKSPEREQIEDFINRNPESVAALLRNWLSDDF